jgi:hypothetical protein
MKKNLPLLVSVLFALVQSASAGTVNDRYIDQLVNGDLETKKVAAESMYRIKEKDREVLDVAAEVLLQNYNEESGSKTAIDTYAWVCKALGVSGDGKYRGVLTEVSVDAENKKLRKYCKKAMKGLPEGSSETYKSGEQSLAKYIKEPVPLEPQMDFLSETGKETLASGKHPFSEVEEGMSMQEVQVVVGYPTNTTSKMTGKAFIPFYQGGDSGRMYSLYQGLGRIEYSRTNAYSSTWLVLSIRENTAEPGYR